MTRDDIIRMAREAGMEFRENADEFNTAYCDGVHRDELERFAALVAAAEREACAVLADLERHCIEMLTSYPPQSAAARNIANAIRARKDLT